MCQTTFLIAHKNKTKNGDSKPQDMTIVVYQDCLSYLLFTIRHKLNIINVIKVCNSVIFLKFLEIDIVCACDMSARVLLSTLFI